MIFSQNASPWTMICGVFRWFYEIFIAVIPVSFDKIIVIIGIVAFVIIINKKTADKKIKKIREKRRYSSLFYKPKKLTRDDEPPPIPKDYKNWKK